MGFPRWHRTAMTLLLVAALAEETRCSSQEADPILQGKPLSQWLAQLEDMNRGNQVRAARALAEAPPEWHARLVPKLIPLLKAERENTRPWAAQALGCYGPVARPAVPDILPLLEGTQYERNRAAGAKALGQILKGAEPSEEVERVIQELIRLFDDQYIDVRREAVRACGMIGPAAKSCIPHLAKRLGDASAGTSVVRDVGREAVWACGEFGPLAACHIDKLISIMHNSPLPQVIEAIGKIGAVHDNIVPNIVDRMEQVAAGAVMIREGYRTHRMGGDLICENMRAGFEALARFGPKSAPAIDYLVRQISATGWEKRKDYALGALKVLGVIGPAAAKAAPVVEKNCLGSADADIKKAAEEALARIKAGS